MTDTPADPGHGTDSQDAPVGGTIQHLDPHSLEIGDNVREYANLNKPFLDSIAEHGVLTPITAIRRPDGVVQVRNGQRRTMAARKLGLSSVPVYVLPATAADTAAETIDRIVHQIVTKDHKSGLTDAQRARGIQQMIDAGLSVSKVAKLSVGKDTVTAAQAAAKSSVALEALEGGQISLAEAGALTEFEHDGPEAVDRLVRAAGTPQFDHVVSQLRCERASAQALAQATAHYTERGFTILDEQQRWGWDPERVPMRYLQRDGDDGEPEGVDESVITDAQHWAVWLDEYTEHVDSDGNVVEEDEIDWDTADDADAEPDEGLRHADSVRERPAFAPEWFCLNPEAAGLQVSEMYQRNADWYARQHRGQSHTAGRDADNHDSDDSDAEREAARLRAEAERAEAERRERRKVITLNKLGAAAIEVRRQFVTTLLARKTLPKGAATFLADCLARDSYMLTQHNRDDVAAELLGIDRATVPTAVSELPAGSDNRALVIALALVLGSLEARAYNLPQGVLAQLLRESAARRPGLLTKVGLGTFCDPRHGGGRLNDTSTAELVDVLELRGEEYLFYPSPAFDVAFIRGTTADENGNLTLEHETAKLGVLPAATAARNSGGLVIAQVKRVAATHTLNPQSVVVPGHLIDMVVVDEDQRQTAINDYNPAFSGEVYVPFGRSAAMPLTERKVVARRALDEIRPASVVNLGVGMADGVATAALEEDRLTEMTLTVEQGMVGGVPERGVIFGVAWNPEAVIEHASVFDFYDGGGLDVACLGFAEVDKVGNVNASLVDGRIFGAGGFINISQAARKVVFCGTLTAGGLRTDLSEGQLRVVTEGKHHKFIDKVHQVTFNAELARERGQEILYVTERAVFVLGEDGPLLVEVAPGWTAEQITALMDFRPKFAEHIRPMSALLFAESRTAATADPTPHHDAQGLID